MTGRNTSKQIDKFRKAAAEHGADSSEEEFNHNLGRVLHTSPKTVLHSSDCAVNSAPAYEPGPCDCGAVTERR